MFEAVQDEPVRPPDPRHPECTKKSGHYDAGYMINSPLFEDLHTDSLQFRALPGDRECCAQPEIDSTAPVEPADERIEECARVVEEKNQFAARPEKADRLFQAVDKIGLFGEVIECGTTEYEIKRVVGEWKSARVGGRRTNRPFRGAQSRLRPKGGLERYIRSEYLRIRFRGRPAEKDLIRTERLLEQIGFQDAQSLRGPAPFAEQIEMHPSLMLRHHRIEMIPRRHFPRDFIPVASLQQVIPTLRGHRILLTVETHSVYLHPYIKENSCGNKDQFEAAHDIRRYSDI